MQNNTKQPSRTSTNTNPTAESRPLPQSMRSEPSQEKAKDLGPEPGPEVRVRYVVNVEHLIHPENVLHGAKSVINVEIRIILVRNVGPDSQEDRTDIPAAHPEDARTRGKHQQSRSRSNQATKSAHSIESASFQDHSGNLHGDSADLHGQQTRDLHGASGSTEFLKQSFSTISRSKSVTSINNDTNPEGKTKILTALQIKLPPL